MFVPFSRAVKRHRVPCMVAAPIARICHRLSMHTRAAGAPGKIRCRAERSRFANSCSKSRKPGSSKSVGRKKSVVLPRLTASDPNAFLLIPLWLLHNEMPALDQYAAGKRFCAPTPTTPKLQRLDNLPAPCDSLAAGLQGLFFQ